MLQQNTSHDIQVKGFHIETNSRVYAEECRRLVPSLELIQNVGKYSIVKVLFSMQCTEAHLQIYAESEGRYCTETCMEGFCSKLLYVCSTYKGYKTFNRILYQ